MQSCEGIRSERQLMRLAADRLSVLSYLGYDLSEPLPDHSSLTRILERYGVEEVLDRVRGYHATGPYKKAYRKRRVRVEPLFAEGKDWHGMRRYRLRLLWRVNCEALMRAAG